VKRGEPGVDQARGRLDHDGVALHHPEPGDHADERTIGLAPEPTANGRVRRERPVRLDVGAARECRHALGLEEPRGEVLAADRVGHRDDPRGRPPVEPAVGRVRPDRLRDVARADDRARRPAESVGGGGEPVLLAAMDVHDVGLRELRDEAAHVGGVGEGRDPAREREGLRAPDPQRPRRRDHPRLASGAAAERHLVAATLELAAHARGPVGVGRPAAAGDELEDSHTRLR